MRIPTKSTVSPRIDTSTTPIRASETAKATFLTTFPTKTAAVEKEETPTKPTRASEEAAETKILITQQGSYSRISSQETAEEVSSRSGIEEHSLPRLETENEEENLKSGPKKKRGPCN
ncbi:hypothetical protein ElyMa_003473300 [Elysia marginata]|uniref:Uncharacterized protein n=1 Tax=Elysia marginata TaxID=1093978 RepID=A0AAV4EBI0_9GAST|nr:hypothetical protein ElyMa_003473300 [Elysia marginata]